jgi:hypothetical protein
VEKLQVRLDRSYAEKDKLEAKLEFSQVGQKQKENLSTFLSVSYIGETLPRKGIIHIKKYSSSKYKGLVTAVHRNIQIYERCRYARKISILFLERQYFH